MSKTVNDLVASVKRYLLSNTPLNSVLQGQPQNASAALMDIELGVISAAQAACVFAQGEHDFAFLDRRGVVRFSRGCPMSLKRVIKRQRVSQVDSTTVIGDATLEQDTVGWPQLILPEDPNGNYWDYESIESVSLPDHPEQRYMVASAFIEDDLVVLELGMQDSEITAVTYTNSVKLSYATMQHFRALRSAKLWNKSMGIERPIKVITDTAFNAKQIETYGYLFQGETLSEASFSEIMAVSNGTKIHLVPIVGPFMELAVDGSVWANELVDLNSTNEFLDYGFDYLKWSCVVDINHIVLKYVPRQEGTMAPPTKQRDEALMNMIKNDSLGIDGSIYHDIK